MTKELSAACAAVPESGWTRIEDRARETVFAADVEFVSGTWPKHAQPLRYVAVKFVGTQLDLQGHVSVKHLSVVTNRRDLSAAALLRWHWAKAGTIEHVHDVVKNELGGGTFPSGKFGANAAWFRFALLTYNILSALKLFALPPSTDTAKPAGDKAEAEALGSRQTQRRVGRTGQTAGRRNKAGVCPLRAVDRPRATSEPRRRRRRPVWPAIGLDGRPRCHTVGHPEWAARTVL